MNISTNFSLSLRLMKHYFLTSALIYFISMLWLLLLDPFLPLSDFKIVGWTHFYMIGFVMLAILSAMSQLGSVVTEAKHINKNLFKYIWKVLLFGLFLLLYGFFVDTQFLLYGGVMIFGAMAAYAIEFLLTLKKMRRKTTITHAMRASNFFLLLGLFSGLIMALGYGGFIDLNPKEFLNAHIFTLIVGFVILLIMGVSIILIPMFGFSKRISDNSFLATYATMSLSVTLMLLTPFIDSKTLQNIAYFLAILATLFYFYQLIGMSKSRKKVEHDIWAKSNYVSFGSFFIAFVLFSFYLIEANELFLKLSLWLTLIGFFGFLIIGNF